MATQSTPDGIYDNRDTHKREWWSGGRIMYWKTASEISVMQRQHPDEVKRFGDLPDIPTKDSHDNRS